MHFMGCMCVMDVIDEMCVLGHMGHMGGVMDIISGMFPNFMHYLTLLPSIHLLSRITQSNSPHSTLLYSTLLHCLQCAERFAPSTSWYVRTVVRVFELAGDKVKPAVAQTLMQLIAEGEGCRALSCSRSAHATCGIALSRIS